MQRNTVIGAVFVGIVVLIALVLVVPNILADWLWYQSLERTDVFSRIITLQIGLFAAGLVVFGVLYFGNMTLVRKIVARQAYNTGEDFLSNSARRTEHVSRVISGIVGVIASVLFGLLASGQWNTVLRAQNLVEFGIADPLFNRDLSFFVFTLPLLEFVQGWLFRAVVLVLVVAVFAYGFRLVLPYMISPEDDEGERREIPKSLVAGPPIRIHLSVLGFLLMVLVGWAHWLSLHTLEFSTRGAAYGASYIDANIMQPVQQVLIVLAVVAAVGLVIGAVFNLQWVPIGGFGLWLLVLVVGGWAYPGLAHRLEVQPNELERERPYIENNIAFTREAYGLNRIVEMEHPGEPAVTQEELVGNPLTVRNFRLWDPEPLLITYNQVQSIRLYYDILDADVDRYYVDGEYRQVMVGARELSPEKLPGSAQTWVNRRLQFTHGYGVVMSPVNEVSPEGLPSFFLKDVPPTGIMDIERPEIYYGEKTFDYVIVNARIAEIDYPRGEDNARSLYQSLSGVGVGTYLRKLLYAWYLKDVNILLSDELTPDSQILYRRQVRERVATVAPFLVIDQDPYIVVADGQLFWIVDAYTFTDRYPYSQPLAGAFNYIRNSVKATVNAYDGTVRLYAVEEGEPILQAYSQAFPDLFQPLSEMPPSILQHIRYPAFLFQVQVELYSLYHMQKPDIFYNREDAFSRPRELYGGGQVPVRPYYVIMRLPDFPREEFILIMPYTPIQKDNMVAWLAARSDPEGYGSLFAFKYPKDKLIFGPMQIEARADQDTTISQQFTLWGQGGSRVIRGNLLVVPIGQSNLYVEPIYLQSEQGQLPELKRVIIANGSNIVMAESVLQGLQQLFGEGVEGIFSGTIAATGGSGTQSGSGTTTAVTPTPAPVILPTPTTAPQPTAQPQVTPQAGTTPTPSQLTPPAATTPGPVNSVQELLDALKRQNELIQQQLELNQQLLDELQNQITDENQDESGSESEE
ncbi:MAG: UPF0182 family protein [Chloroflexota bacterium]|nr:UPF0182 family protein [Chloroflexota bacterium]